MKTLEKISYMQITFICIFTLLLLASGCIKEDDDVNLPGESIELTGSQTTPIVLTNRISNPAIPDYYVTGSWNIQAGVVIEPGVFIEMRSGASIRIQDAGYLNAVGTNAEPITFKGASPTPGYWEYMLFTSNNIENVLDHVIIQDGGGNNGWNAAVYGYTGGRLKFKNSTIRNSARNAFLIYSAEFNLDEFSNNRFENNAMYPVSIRATQMGVMDGLSQFTDNTLNRIEVTGGTIELPQTWSNTQIPYLINHGVRVEADVVVDAGAHIHFGAGPNLTVHSTGSLKAIGTSDENIIFTGEQATSGYWDYILFNGSNNSNNEFQFVEVSYGGGNSSWNAAVYLYNNSMFKMGNSTIRNSQRWGLINYNNQSTFIDDGNNTFSDNVSGDIGD